MRAALHFVPQFLATAWSMKTNKSGPSSTLAGDVCNCISRYSLYRPLEDEYNILSYFQTGSLPFLPVLLSHRWNLPPGK